MRAEEEDVEFQDSDERIAWDRYLAAAIAADEQPGTALRLADELLQARRKRSGKIDG